MNGTNIEKPNQSTQKQQLQLVGRQQLSVQGVEDVLRFEESSILLETDLGTLEVDGEQLRIARLDPDRKEILICGNVGAICYVDTAPKRSGGWFRRRA